MSPQNYRRNDKNKNVSQRLFHIRCAKDLKRPKGVVSVYSGLLGAGILYSAQRFAPLGVPSLSRMGSIQEPRHAGLEFFIAAGANGSV